MSKNNAASHTHRYKKVNIGQNGKVYLVYQCTKPLCSHYIPIHLALGRQCECYRCDGKFFLTNWHLKGTNGKPMAKPHCLECTKTKSGVSLKEVMEKLG